MKLEDLAVEFPPEDPDVEFEDEEADLTQDLTDALSLLDEVKHLLEALSPPQTGHHLTSYMKGEIRRVREEVEVFTGRYDAVDEEKEF